MNDSIEAEPWQYQDGTKVIAIKHTRDDPRHPPANRGLTTVLYIPIDLAAETVDKILNALLRSV